MNINRHKRIHMYSLRVITWKRKKQRKNSSDAFKNIATKGRKMYIAKMRMEKGFSMFQNYLWLNMNEQELKIRKTGARCVRLWRNKSISCIAWEMQTVFMCFHSVCSESMLLFHLGDLLLTFRASLAKIHSVCDIFVRCKKKHSLQNIAKVNVHIVFAQQHSHMHAASQTHSDPRLVKWIHILFLFVLYCVFNAVLFFCLFLLSLGVCVCAREKKYLHINNNMIKMSMIELANGERERETSFPSHEIL